MYQQQASSGGFLFECQKCVIIDLISIFIRAAKPKFLVFFLMNVRRSTGPDDIPLKLLNIATTVITEALTKLFNYIVTASMES